jgi:type III pantothenate kinase
MSNPSFFPLIAVDVGNNRIKFGWFDAAGEDELPQPTRTLQLDGQNTDWDRIGELLPEGGREAVPWWIGSVNRPGATQLLDWLRDENRQPQITMLAAGDLQLAVGVDRPDMVGIDRLLDAVAANHLRRPTRPAVVVDVGSAITVDLISEDGVFLGGAILPGIAMAARALHEFTDLLPLIDMAELTTPPPPVGTSTVPAMRSGLFWGAVGAIRQLTERFGAIVSGDPQLFLTGGAGPAVAALLGRHAQHVPHLTLSAIALTAAGADRS